MPSKADLEFVKLAIAKGFLRREDGRAALLLLRSAEGNKACLSVDRVLVMDEKMSREQADEIQTLQKRRIVFCSCGQKTNVFEFPPGARVLCKTCGAVIEVPEAGPKKRKTRGAHPDRPDRASP
jgi:hypothetical protein